MAEQNEKINSSLSLALQVSENELIL